jgi:DNA-binding beta-propeller fold protein YncE
MTGSTDGTGAAASFNFPSGVAVDGAGNVYVVDHGNSTLRKITAAGVVTTLAGTAGVSGGRDGTGAAARFFFPSGVAVDGAGNVYAAERDRAYLRRITPAGADTVIFDLGNALPGPAVGLVALSMRLAILGDSLIITYNNAVLVLGHAAK